MKNTRAMLAPVNTRKIEASDSPMTPANSQNSSCAVLACIRLMPKLITITKPSGASMISQISGVARDLRVEPGLREHVGDDAGQRQPRRHVVVDAEHILPQADIDVGLRCADRRPHRPAGLRTQSH